MASSPMVMISGVTAGVRRSHHGDAARTLDAYRGIPLQSAYCAAKHAVQGLCESLRAALRLALKKATMPHHNSDT